MTTISSSDPTSLALEERAPGRTSPSHPLTFRIGAALDLKEPAIKEANGSNLDPIAAKDRLTVVVPANAALWPDDQLNVTWTGAAGSPAGGSHTSVPRPVSEGLEVPIPNSVVAFNLGQSVIVTYEVTRGDGAPKPSLPFVLAVLPISADDLLGSTPTVDGADNQAKTLDVTTLTASTHTRIPKWPLIALNQKIWLRYAGTRADGTPYEKTVYDAVPVTPPGLANGAYQPVPLAEFQDLKDSTPLSIICKVAYDGGTNEADAVTFPERIYTVQALVIVTPLIISVRDSRGEVPNGTGITTDTTVNLNGKASVDQEVEIFDGVTPKGLAKANGDGIWTYSVTELPLGARSLTAKALYGSGAISEPWTFTVIQPLTIDTSQLNLSGVLVHAPNWPKSGGDAPGTTHLRNPAGGVPDYRYASSNTAVATVSQGGTVKSVSNGSARITVTDQRGDFVSYPVVVTNVYDLVVNNGSMNFQQAVAWRVSIGGQALTNAAYGALNAEHGVAGTDPYPLSYYWHETTSGFGQCENPALKAMLDKVTRPITLRCYGQDSIGGAWCLKYR